MSMSINELEKALSFRYPNRVSNNSGELSVDGQPPTPEMLADAPQALSDALEANRVKAINDEMSKRIAAACGDESERIRIVAESLGTLYLALRPTLPDSVKATLDGNMTKLQSTGSIRTRAAQMIQDKTLDWN